jgi:hypothetical protein
LVILDSNPLHGRAHPEAASDIKPLLALAVQTRVPVAIPEACLIELREGYRDKVREWAAKMRKAVDELCGILACGVECPQVDEEAEVSAYEARLAVFLQTHDVTTLPFPDRLPEPRELFEAAARKQPPFDSTGNSFRDAVISLSVTQKAAGVDPPIMFVTNDKGLRQALTGGHITCLTVKEAVDDLTNRLSAAARARRARLSAEIRDKLGQQLAELMKRANQDVQFSVAGRLAPGVSLVSIDSFVNGDIRNVQLGDMSPSRLAFSAEMEGQLFCTVRKPWIFAQRRASPPEVLLPRKVGEPFPAFGVVESIPTMYVGPFVSGGDTLERFFKPVTLVLEGDADLGGDDHVAAVSISSLREKPEALSLTLGPFLDSDWPWATRR